MQKKIIICIILFALLLSFVTPSSAKAEAVDVDKLCVEACEALLNDSSMNAILSSGRQYAIGYSDYTGYVTMLLADDGSPGVCIKTWNYKVFICDKLSGKNNTSASEYQYIDGVWKKGGTGAVSIRNNSTCPVIVASNYDTLYDTSTNVVQSNIPSIFEYIEGYSFVDWCDDVDLNCYASSNESDSVIPYSYNDYWHIVRRTSSGKWLLTTIGNSVMADNHTDYTMMYTKDYSKLQVYNLYSGEDVNGYLLNIRQYEYDTDGWRLKSFVTEDSRDTDDCIIDLGVGSGIDSTKVLAYTSTDIYDTGFNLITEATKEYIIPGNPDIPEIDITPTPTSKPNVPDVPDIDISNLDKTLKLQDITIDGFKYNGIEYTWNSSQKDYMTINNLTDYLCFYDDYNMQLIFVWAFDDFMAQAKNQKSGLRFYSYYYEFITKPNNSSVLPYCYSIYQINADGTLECVNSLQNEKADNNHQFSFAWTNPIYEPQMDNIDNFSTYEEYVLSNNLIVSNCDIYNNSGVLVKSAVTLNNELITPDEVPETEIGALKYYLYEKLPIIQTVEVFVKKFNVVLEAMKESGEPPEIIMNFDNYYGFGGEVNVLDVSWYEDYRDPVKAILSAILIIPFILWIYKKGLPEAIGGI